MNTPFVWGSIPGESQKTSQLPQNRTETTPTRASSCSADFASDHHEARQHRCPSCGAGPDIDCTLTPGMTIRRRGRRWHHAARHLARTSRTPERVAERTTQGVAIYKAPTPRQPRPAPPLRPLTPAPVGSLEGRLRAALAGVRRNDGPEAIRAALATSGLRLGIDAVQHWLARLDRERSSRPPNTTTMTTKG